MTALEFYTSLSAIWIAIAMSLRIMIDHLSPIKSAARPIGQTSLSTLPCITLNTFNYKTSLAKLVYFR